MDNLELSQLIYTRISHDLSGCVGAIYNGTELLEEDPTFISESADLIKSSAETLMARLRFFRQTFGLPKKDEDIQDTTTQYLKTFSIPFTLNQTCTNNLQRVLIMCLTDYFYKGANITLTENTIIFSGKALKNIEELVTLFKSGNAAKIALNAPGFYAYYLSQKEKILIQIETEENTVRIKLDINVNP